jgi:DinB superfamily
MTKPKAIGRHERYNRRVLFEERDPSGWVLKALRECANTVVSELSFLDEDTLDRIPADGEWCLKEVAAHVRDAEDLALRQMTAIIEGRRAVLPAWDIDLLPAERNYRSSDVGDLLMEFRQLRRETTDLLWSLTRADWRASGEHPYRGEVTVETLARELAQHDLEHLAEIRRLKHDLGVPAGSFEDDWR